MQPSTSQDVRVQDTAPVRIGVDIGGTFTDLQIFDARNGAIVSLKTPTTPEDPSIGLMTGIRQAASRFGFALGEVGYLLHGTTIATNAVLERKLPKGALITTARFEDVLEIGRHYRREVYALNPLPPPTLVPRDRRLGLEERVRADGAIATPLTARALDDLVERLDRLDVACVAVCLLNAYANPAHERRVAEHLARCRPRLAVCGSAELSAEIREYERASTTVLNALLIPVIAGYVERLSARMRDDGFAPHLLIVQSNGGVCSAATAKREPVRLLLSGPSGGAAASARLGALLGEPHLVGVDMGGTSFDVSVVRDGRVSLVAQGEVDRLPVRLPMVEIRTIGAGGGSIARLQPGGRLTVGPESAGARPGPACYRRGGTEPTVTDANVALGRLDARSFLGGAMPLDIEAARRAIEQRIARPLNLALEAAASGILTVTNANMAAAIRRSLFEKGLDPREFALEAFGGAAGLHATAVADELSIGRIVFPTDASTLSAYGILHGHLVHDLVRSRVVEASPAAVAALRPLLDSLLADAEARLDDDGVPRAQRRIELAADMRYKGQAFELLVPGRRAALDAQALADLVADFHALHKQRFSYANPDDAVEIVSLRASAVGRLPEPQARGRITGGSGGPAGTRRLWLDHHWREVYVWRRDDIADGMIEGPALIEEPYTTILIEAGWSCRREPHGHLIATRTA